MKKTTKTESTKAQKLKSMIWENHEDKQQEQHNHTQNMMTTHSYLEHALLKTDIP